MTKAFLLASDRGDIVASLPTIRALGGGTLFIQAAKHPRVCLTPDKWNGIDRLLLAQPYIKNVVEWKNYTTDYDLNRARTRMFSALRQRQGQDTNLADWFLDTFKIPRTERDTAWLTVEPNPVARVIINRTGPGRDERFWYHNRWFPWARVVEKYRGQSAFIGMPIEHEVFCDVFGEVPYHPTADLFEAAKVIAGCDLFVGNQSCPLWICYGLGKPAIVEVWLRGPNSGIQRANVILGYDHTVKSRLPDL